MLNAKLRSCIYQRLAAIARYSDSVDGKAVQAAFAGLAVLASDRMEIALRLIHMRSAGFLRYDMSAMAGTPLHCGSMGTFSRSA